SVDPWYGRTVVKTNHEFSLKNHPARATDDNAHQVGAVCRRHEIDDRRAAGISFEVGFKDEGTKAVTPIYADRRELWSDEPSTVLSRPKESGKARGRVEARPAQPVNRAVTADQSSRLAITDQDIIFNSQRHYSSALRPSVSCFGARGPSRAV